MSPTLATLFYVGVILALFALDREPNGRVSKALWIPVAWLFLNGSRPISQWLVIFGFRGMAVNVDSPDFYLDGSPVDATVWGILLVAGVAMLITRRKKIGSLLRANAPILVFFGYCAISILWSDFEFVAFKRWIKAVGDIVMILIVVSEPDTLAGVKRFLARTSFVLIPLSALFIKYYPDFGRAYNVWTWLPEYVGVSTTKNMLGMICLVCGLASVWRLISIIQNRIGNLQKGKLLAHIIILLMVIWLFKVANSMTSLSCFLMASTVMTMASTRRFTRRPALAHLALATMISLSAFALFFDTSGSLVESLGRNSTLTGRTDIWRAVLSLVGNPLFGTGFESFWLGKRLQMVWDMTAKGIQEAHNGYLEVYLNLGWLGLGLLAWVIGCSYRNILNALRRNSELGRLAFAYFLVALVYNFTEAGFRMMAPVWITFLLGTMVVAVRPVSTKRKHKNLRELPLEPFETRVHV